MATAFAEHLVSLIRIGADGAKHGDPYHASVLAKWITRTEVELVGMTTQTRFGAAEFRAIEAELVRLGVEEATWDRVGGGKVRSIVRRRR